MHRLRMNSDNEQERHQNPRFNANFFEIHSFSWMFNLFKTGYSRDLNENDLYKTLKNQSSSLLGKELEKIWKSETINAFKVNHEPSLFKVLIKMFGYKYMLYGFLLCINELIFRLLQPILVGELLAYFNSNDSDPTIYGHAYINASNLLLCTFISLILHRSAQTKINHCGMKMRVACSSLIFTKALSLSHKSLQGKTTVGQVINLLSNDVNRFDTSTLFLHYVWIGPLQSMAVTYFLWDEIGVLSLLGVATFFFFIPLQGWLGKKLCQHRSKTASKTDERLRLMNEIISSIQMIKMFTWEKSFAKLIEHARKKEIQQIRRSLFLKLILSVFKVVQTRIQVFIIILLYVTFGNYISAQKVFVIVSFYNLLQYSMSMSFVSGLEGIAELRTTIKRIQKFLLLEENSDLMRVLPNFVQRMDGDLQLSSYNSIIKNHMLYIDDKIEPSNNFCIDILNAATKWTDIETKNSLDDINLTIDSGRLVAVIGPVGAGKSSLIQLILRELPLSQGRISVRGEVSYASQEPWLFAGSIKQNIIFISQMDEERYKQVIEVCALKHDLEQFPDGDRTIVGERGVTLSGGQRARINLARAVYKQADIYLLDDPLSAVDSHVGKHLFEKYYLKEKTCLLVTHQLQYLTNVDEIVLIENGNILAKGSYQEIQDSGFYFAKLLGSSEAKSNEPNNNVLNKNNISFNSTLGSHQINLSKIVEIKSNKALAEPNEKAKFQSSVQVSNRVYTSYLSASGNICKIIFLIFTFIFTQVLITGGDYWLNFWINQEEYVFGNKNIVYSNNRTSVAKDSYNTFMPLINNRQNYIFIYTSLIILMTIAILIRCFSCVSVCMKSSINLHNSVFKAIINGSLLFFNTSSSGQFFNRFSNDIGIIDDSLPRILSDTIQIFLVMFGVVLIVGLVNSYFMIIMFIIGIICYCLRCFFIPTLRSIRKLEGITRSPVLAHMKTSLQGLTTIRAFQGEQILSKEFDYHQDLHSSAYYLFFTSNLAFGLWLDLACFIYLSVVTFCFLILDKNSHKEYIGLTLTQIMSVVSKVQWAIRQFTVLENQMNSVQRILEYKKIPQEADNRSTLNKIPPAEWPNSGNIVFQNFNLRYSPNSQYILKNLNFQIQPMEKIGIVGRTGAGKSSIINALFRLALNDGNIIIDDIDIHELTLNDLRSKLSIVPQEPVLFSGTVRKNLDPFDYYPDHVLWNALDEVKLKVVVENLPGGLNARMSDSGSNFSVGQRQLMCLSRAIIRNNKILVLDEATANVDLQTDAVIQNTIRNKFQKCTVLTIAHRLNTILGSDRILVMDAGSIVEFDHPNNLMKHKDGYFYKLAVETGLNTAELVAEEVTNQ